METTARYSPKLIKNKKEDNATLLRSMIGSYLYHWPLFVLFLSITLCLALWYGKRINDIYTITTKILIQNQTKASDAESDKKLDGMDAAKAVEDEMEVLRSRKLVEKVVGDLQLWVNYKKIGSNTDTELYSRSPVTFVSYDPENIVKKETFDITIINWDTFKLKRKNEPARTVRFASTLENANLGKWRLQITPEFYKYLGSTIRINVEVPEKAIQIYSDEIKIKSVSKLSSVVELSLEDANLQRGKDILNVLLNGYNQLSVEEKKESAEKALMFIDDRLASLKGELTSIENNFENFRSNQGITNVSSEAELFLQNVKSNDERLNEVNVKLNVIDGIEQFVSQPNASGSAPSVLGISNPALESLVNQLSTLQLKRDQLRATTPESNPDFEALNIPIVTTRAAIKENIEGMKASLLNVRSQLNLKNKQIESSIKRIPAQERQYLNIKRQQTSKESLYLYLLQKREAAALAYNSSITNNRKVDFNFKKAEKKPLVFGMALFLGFVLPIGLIFTRELLNNKVTRRQEIEEMCSAPILVELIRDQTGAQIVAGAGKQGSILGEQFRTLKSNMEHFYRQGNEGRVSLYTSSLSSEGKSFVVTNLGLTFAAAGKKTIVLEFDFKKPRIGKVFGSESAPGLGDWLTSDLDVKEIIQQSDQYKNLHFISAGNVPADQSQILESHKIGELFKQLRVVYDEILIDSPPVFLIADAMILGRYTDLTLYVVRQGAARKRHLQYLQSIIEEEKFPMLGIIFNGIQKGGKYGYYTNHDYSYYKTALPFKARVNQFVLGFLRRF